jgi:formylglycine-generating enzyme required for sulfatase activity
MFRTLAVGAVCFGLMMALCGCPPPNTEDTETIMLPGNVPLEMVWIPAGTFMMGSPDSEQDRKSDEGPQHAVILSGFWMAKYELTKLQWFVVMGSAPWWGHADALNDLDSPAVYVSWNDAQAFITALNAYTGLTFRLPSEAEWEYACRAGTTTRFYWGDDPSYTVINDYAWCDENAVEANEHYAHVVGTKLPNDFGLYDMSGNVWEWCQDWYSDTYYASGGPPWTNPVGPATGEYRVLRGGSYYDYGDPYRRSASRGTTTTTSTYAEFGFRLAR